MLLLLGVTYTHPNRDLLFTDLHLSINKQDKIALIGNNGAGKSTLLKIIAGVLMPAAGLIKAEVQPYYVPQLFGQFNNYTVAQALQVADKLNALQQILNGQVTDANLTTLDDDWGIEERCQEAFTYWQLENISLTQQMSTLSGGQKTKVMLAGIMIHRPGIVLLDEPSNHLDKTSRDILYDYITTTTDTLVVVSHDRTLLNLLNNVYELSKRGITVYGGNYDFYVAQKAIESDALQQDVRSKEKALRKARDVERESIERQQKLDARGKKKQEKAGLPTISMNTFKNNAEKSTARMKGVHAEKVGAISDELQQLRKELPDTDRMKIDFDNAALHKGKILVTAKEINVAYGDKQLWPTPLSFQITSGQRIAIKGPNGAGKTTLIKLILGEPQAKTDQPQNQTGQPQPPTDQPPTHPNQPQIQSGSLERATLNAIYIDQDYSLINNPLTVYQQAQHYNSGALQEHEIKTRLNRFLFTKEDWDKPCSALSGGEKMRLMLCCLAIGNQAPDMIILDEPTNNLDIQNIEILTAAINEYQGTLLVVSHDAWFLKETGVTDEIFCPGK